MPFSRSNAPFLYVMIHFVRRQLPMTRVFGSHKRRPRGRENSFFAVVEGLPRYETVPFFSLRPCGTPRINFLECALVILQASEEANAEEYSDQPLVLI